MTIIPTTLLTITTKRCRANKDHGSGIKVTASNGETMWFERITNHDDAASIFAEFHIDRFYNVTCWHRGDCRGGYVYVAQGAELKWPNAFVQYLEDFGR